MTKLLLFLFLLSMAHLKQSNKEPFTAEHMHQVNRVSSVIMDPTHKYMIYVNRIWVKSDNKYKTNIKYIDVADPSKEINFTEPSFETSDSAPTFSEAFKDYLFFLRVQKGKSELYYKKFPGTAQDAPVKLSDYLLDIGDIKIVKNTLVFSADVYYECGSDFKCTKDRDDEVAKRGSNTYFTYTKLMMRHWDHWYTEGKAYHAFYQKLGKDAEGKPTIEGEAIDLVDINGDKEYQSPPIENGAEQFAISPDEKYIAFSALSRNKEMSYNTKWNVYLYNTQDKSVKDISTVSKGRCQNPAFNADGTKLAMLCMRRYGLESDALRFNIHTIGGETKPATNDDDFKPSVGSFIWWGDKFVINTVNEGLVSLFSYDFNAPKESAYVKLTGDHDLMAYGLPCAIIEDTFYIDFSSFRFPTVLGKITLNPDSKVYEPTVLCDPNKEYMSSFEMVEGEVFYFTGAGGDKVQGFIMKPTNFEEGKKYPLAYLIHGGPEGAWEPAWSYRWNPNLWANHGYAVVMINPHGSSGMGIDFQDAVRYDWGGKPFEDIMLGWEYVTSNYTFIDKDRVGACGASYGGYMINWIQGHNDEGKFKVLVTHDGVFSTITMFYATEEMWFPMSEYCPHDGWGCKPYNDSERIGYEKYNPEYYAQNWKTPHLIIHGSLDYRIPVTEGISAFTTLQIKGVDSRFLHFPDENHWVLKPNNSIKWYQEVLGWLDSHLDNK